MPTSRTLAFSGNSLPYGNALATPDDTPEQYRRGLAMCYGASAVNVIAHGNPFNMPGRTCAQLIGTHAAAVDSALRADPNGLAVMVHDEYVNDRLLANATMAASIANGRTWCGGRRLPGRVRVLNTTMAATPWDDPAYTDAFRRWEQAEKYAIDADIVDGIGTYWDGMVDLRSDQYVASPNSTTAQREQFLQYPPAAVEIHLTNRGYARRKVLGFSAVAAALELAAPPAMCGPNGSLLSYWKLSGPANGIVGAENGGGLVLDHWGTHAGVNHLSNFPGTLAYNAGGDAASFTGGTAFLQSHGASWPMFNTINSYQFKPGGFAVAAWFKPEDSTLSRQLIAGVWKGGAWDYALTWDAVASRFAFTVKGDGVSCTSAESVVQSPVKPNDEWQFVLGEFTGDAIRLWHGDAYGAMTLCGEAARPVVLPLSNAILQVGGNMDGWKLQGELASVALLSRASSAADRAALYAKGNRKGGLV